MITAKMVHLEKYAVMPNHVHLLLLIQGDGRLTAEMEHHDEQGGDETQGVQRPPTKWCR